MVTEAAKTARKFWDNKMVGAGWEEPVQSVKATVSANPSARLHSFSSPPRAVMVSFTLNNNFIYFQYLIVFLS